MKPNPIETVVQILTLIGKPMTIRKIEAYCAWHDIPLDTFDVARAVRSLEKAGRLELTGRGFYVQLKETP